MRSYWNSVVDAFGDVRSDPNFGKSVQFPVPPPVLEPFAGLVKRIHLNWWARTIVTGTPEAQWPELRLKAVAYTMLNGRKPAWGYNREWNGDYLAQSSQESDTHSVAMYTAEMKRMKTGGYLKRVEFSCMAQKLSSKGKTQRRAIVVTDKEIWKLDPTARYKQGGIMSSGAVPLSAVISISICQKPLPLLVLRTSVDATDLVMYIETGAHAVEMAARIVHSSFTTRRQVIDVTVDREISFAIKGMEKSLTAEASGEGGILGGEDIAFKRGRTTSASRDGARSSESRFVLSY
jgi:myosin-1